MDYNDQNAINLTKAIGLSEGGGKFDYTNTSGDAGTSKGAYQWQPGNFENAAKQYNLDPNDFSPKNQNAVAYNQIKSRLDAGLKPWEVAAEWNSGNKDNWKDHSGDTIINGQKIHYDTPAYVQNVKNYYTKLTGGTSGVIPSPYTPSPTLDTSGTNTPPANATPPPPPDLLDQVGKVVNAIFPGKQVGESIGTLAGFIQAKISDAVNGTKLADNYDLSAPTPLQTVADVGQGALMVGGIPAISGAGSVAGRIGMAGLETGAFSGLNTIAGGSTDVGEIAKNTAIGGGIGLATGGLFEGASSLLGKIGGKTAEEILATAEKDVPKLSAPEQKLWYKNQAQTLSETATDMASKAKLAGQQATEQVNKEISDFNQQIGQTSRDEAINLKQPAQKVMKDMSNQYVELTGEAVQGSDALGKTMTTESLANKIDSKFEYNPEVGASLKEDLGIKPPTTLPKIGAETQTEKITNQEILDKARGIMQTISKTARTGGKVYSPAEYQAMQKYSFLMETLGENGVDMTQANQFWKEWAPLRDRIVREIKPFEETNVGKMPFTSTLNTASSVANTSKQVASKLDAQNFISQLEERMKLPAGTIGADTRDAVAGLEKAKLNKENIAQITKETTAQIKADKAEALQQMSLKQYNTEKVARNRAIIKKVILTALAVGGIAQTTIGKTAIHATLGAVGL